MTTRFRLESVGLVTDEGDVNFVFDSDLTVLAGPTGVGKTTLLELIKFGFGGDGHLAPVAVDHVISVELDVAIGDSELHLSRNLHPSRRRTVRAFDKRSREDLGDFGLSDAEPSLSSLLLGAMGLSTDMRAAPRSRTSTRPGARITFNDILTYLYIPQSAINRDIAHSQDSYREPKRKAVFEILFGLTNPGLLALRSRLNELHGEVLLAEREYDTVVAFLRDSGTASRFEVEMQLAEAQREQVRAAEAREALRNAVDPVVDRETLAIRDLLGEAERNLGLANDRSATLNRQLADYTDERRKIESDLSRLRRMHDAGERLASIEFSVCPRCMQSVRDRDAPSDACRLCLQHDAVVASSNEDDTYEITQLEMQLAEIDSQLVGITAQREEVVTAIGDRARLISNLSSELDARTSERISPRLQAFDDLAQALARSRADQDRAEGLLRQWDRADDIGLVARSKLTEQQELERAIDEAQAILDERRRQVIEELNDVFQSTVAAVGIPGVERASIDAESYLPRLNDQIYYRFSSAGGIMTATQISYWLSLLTVALRRRDTFYPAFLLIDSPRLALNNAEALEAALYRRLVTQVDANQGQVQLIVADNELPTEYRRDFDEVDFTYDSPTVSSIAHPGLRNVTTLFGEGSAYETELSEGAESP